MRVLVDKRILVTLLGLLETVLVSLSSLWAEDGYRLWLRYEAVPEGATLDAYQDQLGLVEYNADRASPTLLAAVDELNAGLAGLLGGSPRAGLNSILLGSIGAFEKLDELVSKYDVEAPKGEGYLIKTIRDGSSSQIVVTSETDQGVLYGVFVLLRHLQQHKPIENLEIESEPRIKNRLLNHWDNLTRTIERTMAGASLWNWFDLPYYIEPYYIDYARACASIGINGTVLTNVNANATVLRPEYLEKVAALADAFRPYGIRVYLTARFSAPMEIGGLRTSDPINSDVQSWWREKVEEIYGYIPDFGGFLVKANSEGQPGPQEYGRDHADGANLLAGALAPYGGIVMWRAFVYDFEEGEDRHKQAYNEFKKLDGRFNDNVLIQIKNGPIDFMPREPFHPLFGATPKTAQALELQITQEYMGGDVHMAYLAPMWKETLDSDTYVRGPGSTVARVVDGSVFDNRSTTIAGVSNAGNERNWTGHPMAAANWYAFGRLAWDHSLAPNKIAAEWVRMTFGNQKEVVETITRMLMSSHETVVSYSMPLGLHHIMAAGHHYGPGPWYDGDGGRADWSSTYYHRADRDGIGFDRTESGSNALGQYASEVVAMWDDPNEIDEKLLLWFHHVPWDHRMKSGRTLWDELCLTYQKGVDEIERMIKEWARLEGFIDTQRFTHVSVLLRRQYQDAVFWKDACLTYFHSISKRPYPNEVEEPEHDIEYYKTFKLYHVPGDPAEQF